MRPGAAGICALACALTAVATVTRAQDPVRYTLRVTDIHRVGLTVTNYGFLGNNFNSRSPSFEFPLGAGFEHMSRAGLWIGAQAIDDSGSFTGVSTAIVDNAQGSNSLSETEFTPVGNNIEERSRISNSPSYSAAAQSDQDFVCAFRDVPAKNPSGFQAEPHRPLNIEVLQRTLAFSLPAADAFVVVQYAIVNHGPPLRDLYLGQYAQLVSGNKNAYSTWPPSAGSGPGSWYYSTYAEFDSLRRMYKERYCLMAPYPDGCNIAYAPPWAAVQLLRVEPDTVTAKTVSLNWWSYTPGDASRDTDLEKYRILSNGLTMNPRDCVPGGQCSPIMVLSVGPFAQVFTGDTVRVDFAFVGGETEEDLLRHADYAQFSADIRYRLPLPPPSPRLLVRPGSRSVDLYWDDSPESARDPTSPAPDQKDFEGYRVYLGLDRQNPSRVAQFDLVDTTGFNTGLDSLRLATPLLVDGIVYRNHHRIEGLRDGFSYYGGVTSYDLGDETVESLESGLGQNKFQAVPAPGPGERPGVTVFPNPYRVEARWDQGSQVRDHYLWFAGLPRRARLRIYTLGGDRIFEAAFDGGTYRGESARGLYDPRQDLDTPPPALSGSTFAWNLISDRGQAIASGLYLFAVEDLETGSVTRGKFLVVKSDREGR